MSHRIRAVFAIPGDLNTPTGGYVYARHLIECLPACGVEVFVLPLPDGFPHADPAVLETTDGVLRATLAAAKGLAAADGDLRQVLLIDGMALSGFQTYDRLEGSAVLPLVVLCHHPSALEQGMDAALAAEIGAAETRALAHARACITTSSATVDALAQAYGYAADLCTVAPPGTDDAPRAIGSRGRTCQILTVGSLTPRKGHEGLIEALAALDDLPWHWTLVGPHRDAETTARVKALIAQHGLTDRVTLTGPLTGAALESAYAGADLFVLASRYEGFGMVFTEAMTRGLPTVGLQQEAVAEATRGGALLVDADTLASGLRPLIAEPQVRAAWAARAVEASAGFTRWPETARIVADVLIAHAASAEVS